MAACDDLTPQDVLRAAQDGDELAQFVFDRTASWLGQALSACIALLNPERIIIGGGMGLAAYDLLMPGAQAEIRRRVLPLSYANLRFERSQVHSSAVGASSLIWHAQDQHHAV
jgi:glucokinase